MVGLPDEKWGERVDRRRPAAARAQRVDAAELAAFVKERIGSVKAPKQVEVWADLPRSKVGKVLKTDDPEAPAASLTAAGSGGGPPLDRGRYRLSP